MKRESFQNALLATARIACCSALFGVGCETKDDTVNTDTASTDTSTDTETEMDEVSECEEIVETAFTETWPEGTWPDSSEIDQATKDCCQLIAENYDSLDDWNASMDWEYRDQCCSALDWQGGTNACTPWGPPTPPAMSKSHKRIKIKRFRHDVA